MSSLLFLSIILLYLITPSKSEWNCEGERGKCACEYGNCTMFGQSGYAEYICTHSAESCTVHCHDAHSCAGSKFHMMASRNTEVICNGTNSCANSTIYCGESTTQRCTIKINHKGMSDGYIECDDNISQCNVEIISTPNQIAMHRTTFECMSPIGCQLNGCNHNQCIQSHMHCIDASCSCVGKDCMNSNVNIHRWIDLKHVSNRHLLQFNTTATSSGLHMRSGDLSLPDFSVMEYVTIAVSLAFCCGTCAIFLVICYCQRLKYHVIKRYRTSQCAQQQESKALQNHSDDSSEHTSNMHTNSNCDSTQSVSLEIHEDGDEPTTQPHVLHPNTHHMESTTSSSIPPTPNASTEAEMKANTPLAIVCTTGSQTKPKPIFIDDRDSSPFITSASFPADTIQYHGTSAPHHLKMLQQSHPAAFGTGAGSTDSTMDPNGVQHHHHHIYYHNSPVPYSSATVQFNGTNTSQFPSSGPSLPYSPTTTYHEQQASQASQCVTSLINGYHPTQTLQIPNKLRFPKSSSHMSASTLTSITSTRCDVVPPCLAPTSMSSEVSSMDSSNGSIYVCRFEESQTFARRPSFRDILGVPSLPTQRTNSKDFALKGLCDTILSDDVLSNTVHAVLPDMIDVEKSLSETPEPHALT